MKTNTNHRKAAVAGWVALLFLVLTILPAAMMSTLTYSAYAQTTAPTSQNTTSTTTAGMTDFKTLRDNYLAQWQQLPFQSGFETFVEPYSVQGYGVYEERPSNVFNPETSAITLYVEPIGYGFKEGIDEKGNTLYSFNFSATITISGDRGNVLMPPIPAQFDKPANSHNKATEAFMPITLTFDRPLPVGQYRVTYNITDGTSGKSFGIEKGIRIAEILS